MIHYYCVNGGLDVCTIDEGNDDVELLLLVWVRLSSSIQLTTMLGKHPFP